MPILSKMQLRILDEGGLEVPAEQNAEVPAEQNAEVPVADDVPEAFQDSEEAKQKRVESKKLEEFLEQLEELRHLQKEAVEEMARRAAIIVQATQLAAKMDTEKIRKRGKEGVSCGVEKKNADGFCSAPGDLSQGLFCGRHKNLVSSPSFSEVLKALAPFGQTLTQIVASRNDQKEPVIQVLQTLVAQTEQHRLAAEVNALKFKDRIEVLQGEIKAQKEKVAKMRGAREAALYFILEKEIGIYLTHRSGEFGMVGNDCKKVLKKHSLLLETLHGHPALQAKYEGLFVKLESVAEILYRIEPLSTIVLKEDHIEEEQEEEEEEEIQRQEDCEDEEEQEELGLELDQDREDEQERRKRRKRRSSQS